MNEADYILHNHQGERPPAVRLRFTAECVQPSKSLELVKLVALRFAEARLAAGWPEIDEWMRVLPPWLLQAFGNHTARQIKDDLNLWAPAAWIEAMKTPGWLWYSSDLGVGRIGINGTAFDYPYRVQQFIFLLKAAGASSVSFQELD